MERSSHNAIATEPARPIGELAAAPVVNPSGIFKSRNAARILLGLASMFLVVCFFEFLACIKLVDFGTLIGPASGDIFLATNRGDPELLHVHPPHSHFGGTSRGGNIAVNFHIPSSDMAPYRWDVTYDHNGFRNDVDLKSANLAVIGDSFVEDIATPTPQLTTSLLGNLQGGEVANLGQYGYGPLEELAVLRRYALPLHPRTVIWMFSEASDLKDVIHYHAVTEHQYKAPGFWSALWGRSFTRNVLAQIYVQGRRALRPSGALRAAVVPGQNGDPRTVYFLYSAGTLSQDELGAADETAHIIAVAHQLGQAQGTRLLFVFIPTKFRVFQPFCQFPQTSECRNWGLNDLPQRLEKSVKSISPDIGYLDLTARLRAAVQQGILPYHPDDDHWSPEGHKIAAEAINEVLSRAGSSSTGLSFVQAAH